MKSILPAIFLLSYAGSVAAEPHFWDTLRPITGAAEGMELTVNLLVFLLSLCIFFISALAYSKSKSRRLLLVSFAFLLFTVKWMVKIVDMAYSPGDFLSDASENVFELGILLSLLVALFYRKSWNGFVGKEPR